MCLAFDFQEAQRNADEHSAVKTLDESESEFKSKRGEHDGISCDGIQVGFFAAPNGMLVQTNRVPIVSATCAFAMLSAPRHALGEHHENIKPGNAIPCLQSDMEAYLDPAQHVPVPKRVHVPRYRSLGGLDDDGCDSDDEVMKRCANISFPKGVFVKNMDGSSTFTLRTAELAQDDDGIAALVESGKFKDKIQFMQQMSNAAVDEVLRGCEENKVDVSALFDCEKDDNGKCVIDPIAKMAFMDEFYPCLIPGSDIVMLIPPIKDGKAVMNTAFSLKLVYPVRPERVWLPGLHHNDTDVEGSEYKVHENYFIFSSAGISLQINNKDTGRPTSVRICEAYECLPTRDHPRWVALVEAAEQGVKDRLGTVQLGRGMLRHEAMSVADRTHNFDVWFKTAAWFQKNRYKEIKDGLLRANAFGTLSAGMFEESDIFGLQVANLLGTMIPKLTNEAKTTPMTVVDPSLKNKVVNMLTGGELDDAEVIDSDNEDDVVMEEEENDESTRIATYAPGTSVV